MKLTSVIIPTYNEQDHIEACIDSLKLQTYKSIEIIIVDDGSTDKTLKILKKIKGIKLIKQNHLGPGTARNKGAKRAKGKILVFIDADMTFDKRFIDKLTKPIRDGKTIGTFTKEEFVSNSHNPWARSWSLIRGFEEGKMHPEDYPDEQPVFRAISSDKFRKSGGFDQNRGYDDDWTLSEKLGKLATVAKGAIIYHANPDSLQEIFTQSKWMATRKYKLGILGKFVALTRSSLPFSLIKASKLTNQYKFSQVFISQIAVDTAITISLIKSFFKPNRSK